MVTKKTTNFSFLFFIFAFLLFGCGSNQTKPQLTTSKLADALALAAPDQVKQYRNINLSAVAGRLVDLYVLMLEQRPRQANRILNQLARLETGLSAEQSVIFKQAKLWVNALLIYRQETAKQVRILQRKTLLLAPSQVDFSHCQQAVAADCASRYRQQLQGMISPQKLTKLLLQMADNDPCINLSGQNLGADVANRCLATHRGERQVELLKVPRFSAEQWQKVLD